jgi:hypothetical protein
MLLRNSTDKGSHLPQLAALYGLEGGGHHAGHIGQRQPHLFAPGVYAQKAGMSGQGGS